MGELSPHHIGSSLHQVSATAVQHHCGLLQRLHGVLVGPGPRGTARCKCSPCSCCTCSRHKPPSDAPGELVKPLQVQKHSYAELHLCASGQQFTFDKGVCSAVSLYLICFVLLTHTGSGLPTVAACHRSCRTNCFGPLCMGCLD